MDTTIVHSAVDATVNNVTAVVSNILVIVITGLLLRLRLKINRMLKQTTDSKE